jgi:hypothetical protein
MTEQMTFMDGLYVVEFLAGVILVLIGRRRRRGKNPELNAADNSHNSTLFAVPFAVDTRRQVTAYGEIVPNFRIGFDDAMESVVFVSQRLNENSTFAPSLHRYILAIHVVELRESKWITIESTTGHIDAGKNLRASVTIVARISKPSNLIVEFIIPQKSGMDNSIHLGVASMTMDYNGFSFMELIGPDALGDPDHSKRSRVAIFLPLLDGVLIEIGAFDVYLEKI